MRENLLKATGRQWFRWYLNRFPLRDGKARLYQTYHQVFMPSERFMVTEIDPGFRLRCDLQDPEQRKIYFYGHYHERYEARLIRAMLSPGENFWDIGANIGYFTLLAATALANTGRIVAFEPGQTAFQRLQENIGLNNFRNITAVNLAASNSTGDAKLYLSTQIADTGASLYQAGDDRTEFEIIPTISLDAFLTQEHLPPPQFLKIDVEGAELAVIQGAAKPTQTLVIVLFANGKSRCDGVIEDQINLKVEQVGRPEEDRLFHGRSVGLEHVHLTTGPK